MLPESVSRNQRHEIKNEMSELTEIMVRVYGKGADGCGACISFGGYLEGWA